MVSDPGRATAPRITAQPMLPSTVLNGSASARTSISGLNTYPIRSLCTLRERRHRRPRNTRYRAARYDLTRAGLPPAGPRQLRLAHQHSLPSARYGLLGPDFHRLDRASFAWRATVTITSVTCNAGGRSASREVAVVHCKHEIGFSVRSPHSSELHHHHDSEHLTIGAEDEALALGFHVLTRSLNLRPCLS